ncbi:recombinase family protein [Kitasatospora sp. NPDC052868]|uniref:recombinase family protein n=1 Tax=Kitasatospora sp. NPDC052868 TaxID=3364060 RepID=UPI0037C7D708
MRPLIFGYMRVPDDMPDEEVKLVEDQMLAYAEAQGGALGAVFHEFVHGSLSAFEELVRAVEQSGAPHAVVPSYRDLALTRALQDVMILRIEYATGAQVAALDEDR